MRFLILAAIAVVLASCQIQKKPGVDPDTGLTQTEFDSIKSINEALHDLNAAVALGTGAGSGALAKPAPSEKALKLAEMMQKGGCRSSGQPDPAEKFDHSWDASFLLESGACPLAVTREWHYRIDSSGRSLTESRSFKALSSDFQSASMIQSYGILNSQLGVTNIGNSQRVQGAINYHSFVVKDVGLIVAGLSTDQSYVNRRGSGTLTFTIDAHEQFKAKVVMDWHDGHADNYRINGYEVNKNVVLELFSAFQLMEIKDRSRNLLY